MVKKTGVKTEKLIVMAVATVMIMGLGVGSISAADYPKRPIMLICPWAPAVAQMPCLESWPLFSRRNSGCLST
jgi:hypothetical protein